MTGKAYQLKEMKGIVDYLVEHKSYSEIRGRKMWMDFANSSATTRTWQSLKETFLKRILPDIQNPYYQLTRDQVCSFQQGCDVLAKEKNNRLEIRSASPDPKDKAAENQNDKDQASTSNENGNEVEKAPGMDKKHAKITSRNRSSADTVIIEGDAENINDEESENEKIRQKNEELIQSAKAVLGDIDETSKSLKDCLEFEYSEPLTPLVKRVINDFETESEGSDNEPRMQIVDINAEENVEVILADENDDTNADSDLIIIEDTENTGGVEEYNNAEDKVLTEDGHEVEVGPIFEEEVITESINDWLKDCAQQDDPKSKDNAETNAVNVNGCNNQQQSDATKIDDPIIIDSENTAEILARDKEGNKKSTNDDHKNNQNSLSTTADTIIPNNQEVLDGNITKSQNKTNASQNVPASSKDTASRKRSTSQDNNANKKQKVDDEIETAKKENEPKTNGKANIIEINSGTINTEEAFDALKKDTVPDECQPCTSKQAKQMEVKMLEKNPCLQSVSLFEEQFNTTKYSDSDVETPITNNKVKEKSPETQAEANNKDADLTQETQITNANQVKASVEKKEVIVLKSESDSEEARPVTLKEPEKLTLRYKHLSKAFGFAAGPSTSNQRRRSLRCRTRKSKSQRNSVTIRSDSSQWETGSASDAYVSPPRGRRNKQARRFLKPASARIISLDEDGGLVVVHRNKIYPIVKDGRNIKTYVTYDAGSGSEEEDNNFWRQKYVEEKKKAAELQKQLNQAQAQPLAGPSRAKSPILQTNTKRNATSSVGNVQTPSEVSMSNKVDIAQIGDSGKIQITLSKCNEEAINLEGHWPQVLPIVQQVMSIFYKTDAQETKQVENKVPENKQGAEVPTSDQTGLKQIDSGQTTPIIPVVDISARSKVEELESAIFKEIEEIDKVDGKDIVTNKRKVGRPKKTSTSSDQSEPAKKQRKSKIKLQEKATPLQTAQTNGIQSDASSEVKVTRSKVKRDLVLEIPEQDLEPKATEQNKVQVVEPKKSLEPPVTRTQAKKPRKSGNETDSSTRTIATRLSAKPKGDDDDEARYMLPPEPKRKSASKKAESSENPHEISQDRSRMSVDSTQGYQDSDASPVTVNTKRRRKVSLTVRKGKLVTRRKSTSSIREVSLDSSNSSYFVPTKKTQTTLDSAVYKTESYQLLMQNRKISITKLDAIDESQANHDDLRHFNAVSNSSDTSNIIIEIGGSSSNVSLPLSPELSVVENLSISRELIQDKHHPSINEIQANDSIVGNIYNQYLISDVDVSVPLMEQECGLRNSSKGRVNEQNLHSESLSKISAMNNATDLSDTLDKRLRDLLLESAKKMTVTDKENLGSQPMEVDESNVETSKKKGKKRCSTPQKRNTKKGKVNVNPVIDEHMEMCSRGGRTSCPPVITFVPDENANNSSDVQLTKTARKKDIIKVKITRPKPNKLSNKTRIEKSVCTSRASLYTDSGINETASISGVLLEGSSEMEFIHNHSETCLHANECVGDSIEFVENSKSIISLNSTASLEDELLKVMEDVEKLSGCYRSRVAQEIDKSAEDVFLTPTETVYNSPVASNSSLLTEDLSDEAPLPPTKWYLLTEDEATNSRPEQTNTRTTNFSANLKHLFPITCAVPDLSTISEMSKENEDSRKAGLESDGDTRSSDYQNLL